MGEWDREPPDPSRLNESEITLYDNSLYKDATRDAVMDIKEPQHGSTNEKTTSISHDEMVRRNLLNHGGCFPQTQEECLINNKSQQYLSK